MTTRAPEIRLCTTKRIEYSGVRYLHESFSGWGRKVGLGGAMYLPEPD